VSRHARTSTILSALTGRTNSTDSSPNLCHSGENGGSDGTRTRGLLRDGQAFQFE
jgi:hypothetical protein